MNSHVSIDAALAAAVTPPLDNRESSDRYRRELVRDGDWRLIVCRDQIQWIIQRKTRADSPAGPRWVSIDYVTTQTALARLWPGSQTAGRGYVAALPRTIRLWREANS